MKLIERIRKRQALKRIGNDLHEGNLILNNQKPMKTLLTRLTSESPAFFKKIQAIGITLGAVGVAIIAIPASVVVLPAAIVSAAGYFIAIGSVAAAVAKTTVKDTDVLKKD